MWHTSLIKALEQKQLSMSFEASLIFIVSSRTLTQKKKKKTTEGWNLNPCPMTHDHLFLQLQVIGVSSGLCGHLHTGGRHTDTTYAQK